MITTAVDSNIWLDVILKDPNFGDSSYEALQKADSQGPIIIAPVVAAEIASVFTSASKAVDQLASFRARLVDMDFEQLILAGQAWKNKKTPRTKRILPDYLIAVHAAMNADRLLTRDSDLGRLPIKRLRIVSPQQLTL